MPATTPDTRCRVLGCDGAPNDSALRQAIGPRAHGEHVAQDAADAGGGALVGLDVARVVVALHLEHAGEPVADVDDAGILARTLDHVRTLGRQRAQVHFEDLYEQCSLHMAEKMPSSVRLRLAPDQVEHALVLVGLEAVLGDQFGGDFGFVRDHCHNLKPVRPIRNLQPEQAWPKQINRRTAVLPYPVIAIAGIIQKLARSFT